MIWIFLKDGRCIKVSEQLVEIILNFKKFIKKYIIILIMLQASYFYNIKILIQVYWFSIAKLDQNKDPNQHNWDTFICVIQNHHPLKIIV